MAHGTKTVDVAFERTSYPLTWRLVEVLWWDKAGCVLLVCGRLRVIVSLFDT